MEPAEEPPAEGSWLTTLKHVAQNVPRFCDNGMRKNKDLKRKSESGRSRRALGPITLQSAAVAYRPCKRRGHARSWPPRPCIIQSVTARDQSSKSLAGATSAGRGARSEGSRPISAFRDKRSMK
ncbi:hypothetical protein GFL86_06490 [Rhizobium laguerreae]|nr:hypothetical protein [Rhizobium laguerreae]